MSLSNPRSSSNFVIDLEKERNVAKAKTPKSVASQSKFSSMNNSEKPFEPPNYKIEVVFSLLSMLSTQGRLESSNAFLRLSKEAANCQLMIESGCISLIVQLLHPSESSTSEPTSEDIQVFERAAQTLRNVVMSQSDKTKRSRESKILRLLEKIRSYVLHLRFVYAGLQNFSVAFLEKEVCPCVTMLMKSSFDEENRATTSLLGGLQAICETVILDQMVFGENAGAKNFLLRRYIGMALTNLTFGDLRNKHMLCSYSNFLPTVNLQIQSGKDDLRQVYASVLRNLSWKADPVSKIALRNAQTVPLLMKAAMETKRKPALKSILSALWNLTAHCSENQVAVCNVPSAIEFLVSALKIHGAAGSNAILENCGGILRNISAQIASREEHRRTLRNCGYYPILLSHLRSPNLTVVSNACGTIWNLSAQNAHDQRYLRDLGAIPLLKKLIHSKHALIKLASASALKNLSYIQMVSPSSATAFGKTTLLSSACDFTEDTRMNASAVASTSKAFFDSVCFRECDNRADDLISNLSESFCSSNFDTTCLSTSYDRSGVSEAIFDSQPGQSTSAYTSSRNLFDCETTHETRTGESHMESPKMMRTGQPQQTSTNPSPLKQNNPSSISMISASDLKAMQNRVAVCEQNSEPFVGEQETLKRFAVEDTPSQLSLRSSFSSLHAAVVEQPSKLTVTAEFGDAKVQGQGQVADGGGRVDPNEAKTSSNMTPMVFSRHSSLQSLNSCDQQSVHSTVYSEYSQFQTGQVSPSELPDSPSQSAPPSCVADKKDMSEQAPRSYQEAYGRAESSFHNLVLADKSVTDYSNDLDDRPKVYHNEGSGIGGLSSASSLSALTVEPDIKIKPSGHVSHSRIPIINGNGNGNGTSTATGVKRHTDFVAVDSRSGVECFGFRAPFVTSLGPATVNSELCRDRSRQEQISCSKSIEKLSDKDIPEATLIAANVDSATTKVSSTCERRAEASSEVPDILTVIQLAMPKPRTSKSVHHKHSGKGFGGGRGLSNASRPAIANVKPTFYSPMKCDQATVPASVSGLACHYVPNISSMSENLVLLSGEEDVKVYTSESTPGFSLRSSWSDLRTEEKTQAPRVSENPSLQSPAGAAVATDPSDFAKQRCELKECIYNAFPKPRPSRKSKSLDRKTPFSVAPPQALNGNLSHKPAPVGRSSKC